MKVSEVATPNVVVIVLAIVGVIVIGGLTVIVSRYFVTAVVESVAVTVSLITLAVVEFVAANELARFKVARFVEEVSSDIPETPEDKVNVLLPVPLVAVNTL